MLGRYGELQGIWNDGYRSVVNRAGWVCFVCLRAKKQKKNTAGNGRREERGEGEGVRAGLVVRLPVLRHQTPGLRRDLVQRELDVRELGAGELGV